jgi:hypothetical protein
MPPLEAPPPTASGTLAGEIGTIGVRGPGTWRVRFLERDADGGWFYAVEPM